MDEITREPGGSSPAPDHGRPPNRPEHQDGDDPRAGRAPEDAGDPFEAAMSGDGPSEPGARRFVPPASIDPEVTDAELERVAQEAGLDRDDEAGEDAAPVLTEPDEVARVLLAVLLLAREPVSFLRLAQACNCTQQAVRDGLARLEQQLRASGLPLEVALAGETARVLTLPEVFPYLQRFKGIRKAERLSPAALETLAVIAYRQPVMRSEIEAIRGVKAGPMLRTLLEHKLIAITGRAEVPGRPLQYGTTQRFLDRFGLRSLDELPSPKELKSLGG